MSLQGKLARALAGALFEDVVQWEHNWRFGFGRAFLVVECPWRIVDEGRIVLTASDHGQQFGLPAPVDALAEARRRLLGRKVVEARVEAETGDLRMLLEGGARLELVSDSSGYEAWVFHRGDWIVVSAGGRLIETRAARTAG